MLEEWQNFEIVQFSNYTGWEPRFLVISHIFLSIVLEGNNPSTINQGFIKGIWENQVSSGQ